MAITRRDAVSGMHSEEVVALDAVEREWRMLGERSDNMFATWEWLSTWWRHFGRDRQLLVSVHRRADGTPVAIVPLYLATRRPVRVVRLLGHGASDELGPVCDPADRVLAAAALRDRLHAPSLPCDLAIADELPGVLAWSSVLGGRCLARTPSPVVRIDGIDWPGFLAQRSKNFREQLHRKARRLADVGRVTLRWTDDPERLDDDLTTFFALHAARWEPAGGSRSFTGREPFHRDFAARALARGWLRLWFCEVDGRPVAALYNVRLGDRESMYQAARDPAFARYSVGLILQAHALRTAVTDGLAEYRFLRGAEHYKSRFANEDHGLEAVAVARGARARAVLRALAPVPRLPRKLRRCIPASLAWGTGGAPYWGPP